MITVHILINSLYYALAISFALAFWLVWHRDHKNVAGFVLLPVSIFWLVAAIGLTAGAQLLFGAVYIAILYGCYRWIRETRHDRKQDTTVTRKGGEK